jgi:hypothetical protein
LQKGLEPISQDLIMYEVAFEQLTFPRSIGSLSAYQVWIQYFQDEVEGRVYFFIKKYKNFVFWKSKGQETHEGSSDF